MSKSKVFVLVGDSACGKSSLASMFATNTFTVNHYETEFEDYSAEMEGPDGFIQLRIYDTSGREQDVELRNLCYGESDAVLVCFDLTDPASLENVEKKWIPEVTRQCPGKPFFLVGCKKDLLRTMRKFSIDASMFISKEDESSGFVSEEDESPNGTERYTRLSSPRLNHADIWSLQLESGAMGYFECSARTAENVSSIFTRIVEILDCEWKKLGRSTWPRKKAATISVSPKHKERSNSQNESYLDIMRIRKGFANKIKKFRRSISQSITSSTPKLDNIGEVPS